MAKKKPKPMPKEAFQDKSFYPAIEAFLEHGYCEVHKSDADVVKAVLGLIGYEAEITKGKADFLSRLYSSCFPFPSDNEQNENDQEKTAVARIILQQLGGNKFIAMTGSRNFLSDGNTLRMQLVKNKSGANRLFITLNGKDLYDMRFFYYRAPNIKVDSKRGRIIDIPEVTKEIALFNDVYCDQLASIFIETTGLYTHL